MPRFKCCKLDKDEVNPLAAALNFLAACLIVCAIFNEWLILKSMNEDNSSKNISNSRIYYVKYLINDITQEFSISNCSAIGSQLFLLPARFTSITRNGTNHILYHYDDLVYLDCITPEIANYFYFITAFCFVVMIVSTFGALLHSTSPSFQFFNYLRLISALEIIVVIIIGMILLLIVAAKGQVQKLQMYSDERRKVITGMSVYLVIACGVLTLNAAIISQLRQRRVRMDRRQENKRLMCTRPLRSRRDTEQNDYDPQPIAELERYLLEPGLRGPSISTISTACVEDELNEHEMEQLIS